MLLAAASCSWAQSYETSWLGNSFSGASSPATQQQGTSGLHVQTDIWGMAVSSDGTCYTNSQWDEAGAEAGIYANGQVIGNCLGLHGWGRGGGSAIALDARYIYVAITQSGDDGGNPNANSNGVAQYPPPNNIWYCVRRYTRAGVPAPFGAGYGFDDTMLRVNAGSRPVPVPNHAALPYSGQSISGIAVDGSFLYVSDPAANQVKKYALTTLSSTPVSTWAVADPGAMVMIHGALFVAQGGTHPKVLKFTPTGSLSATISLAPGAQPSALASQMSHGVPFLMVADDGPDQDIKEYDLADLRGTPTKPASVFGTVGGIYAGRGAQIGIAGPRRFNHPTGVGVDAQGNIYVSQDGTCGNGTGGGGTVLECYTPGGSLRWQLLGLEFVDCADIDPASEGDAYTKEEHFVMNYATAIPGTEATYHGYTVNRFKYPEDPRSHIGVGLEASAWVREYRGHKFLITTDMYDQYLIISRFNAATDGECAIPSTMFSESHGTPDTTGWPENQPNDGEWIWRDMNGNGSLDAGEYAQPSPPTNLPQMWGLWVDSSLDVWEATVNDGIRHFACQGLDSHGSPIYDYAHMTTTPMPPQFTDLRRIEYDPATDTMYLAGYNAAQPNPGDWGGSGRVYCRYDHWSTSPTLHTGYPIVPPHGAGEALASMSVAGAYLFVTYGAQNRILAYNADTGAQAATIIPGASVGGNSSDTQVLGWTDIRNGLRAYRRADGEYEIFNEDDWLGKVVLYRWTP